MTKRVISRIHDHTSSYVITLGIRPESGQTHTDHRWTYTRRLGSTSRWSSNTKYTLHVKYLHIRNNPLAHSIGSNHLPRILSISGTVLPCHGLPCLPQSSHHYSRRPLLGIWRPIGRSEGQSSWNSFTAKRETNSHKYARMSTPCKNGKIFHEGHIKSNENIAKKTRSGIVKIASGSGFLDII